MIRQEIISPSHHDCARDVFPGTPTTARLPQDSRADNSCIPQGGIALLPRSCPPVQLAETQRTARGPVRIFPANPVTKQSTNEPDSCAGVQGSPSGTG